MRVHASPSQPSDQASAGDQEFSSEAVGRLPPGPILEEMEALSGPLKKTDDSYRDLDAFISQTKSFSILQVSKG